MKNLPQVPSVYIAIATLEDDEIVDTVESALNNADNDINIGIAFSTSKSFYEDKIKKINKNKNIKHKLIDIKENFGTGKGRNVAAKMYGGEDYFLQVDSHTEFEKGWDSKLINIFNEAKHMLSLEKFVLTAALGRYTRLKGQRKIIDRETNYLFLKNKDFYEGTNNVPKYFGQKLKYPLILKQKIFYPAISICGCFIFGDKNFAKNYGLPEECIFNEEQLLQSINLLSDGFSLVFVNKKLPLTHYYIQDEEIGDGKRQTIKDITTHDWGKIQSNNVKNFIENNFEKCEYYKKYSTYDLTDGSCLEYHIPKKFILPQ